MPRPFRAQDSRLFLAFGHGYIGLARTGGLKYYGSPLPLSRHLPVHGVLYLRRWVDLADLHRRHLDPPALGHLVQLHPEDLVYLLPLRQHIVQGDVADHGPQGCGGHTYYCRLEVLHLQDRTLRRFFYHLVVDEEVDAYRSVVLGDVGLAGYVDHIFPQVHLLEAVHKGQEQAQAGASKTYEFAQAKSDYPLVLPDDDDGQYHCRYHIDPPFRLNPSHCKG